MCSGVSVVACLLLGILSFHSDALGLDESVRARWAGLSLEQREVSSSYSDLKTHCLRNFAVLGVACVALVAVQVGHDTHTRSGLWKAGRGVAAPLLFLLLLFFCFVCWCSLLPS